MRRVETGTIRRRRVLQPGRASERVERPFLEARAGARRLCLGAGDRRQPLARRPGRGAARHPHVMIACVLIVPYAFVFGGLRGIPIPWRLIDCSFGVFGFIPMWFCQRSAAELARKQLSNEALPAPPAN